MSEVITATTGRGGLQLPEIQLDDASALELKVKFLHYFQNLWQLNDFDVTCERPYSGGGTVPVAFEHELVVPPSHGKQLAVLRASYSPRELSQDESDQAAYGAGTVSRGWERYDLLIPPKATGKFQSFFSVAYEHRTGNFYPEGVFNDRSLRAQFMGRELPYDKQEQLPRFTRSNDENVSAQLSAERQLKRTFQKSVELLEIPQR